ncbi:hypothetical protein [Paenibacillus senegalensis]|uniref:hypothetical protein n=1 Tax=Paenibacillus senegalensis TaxID=1465766 RepID=UPI000287E283|nr:hypothetical protein [Paenibacillus senegalensis]
MNKYIISGAMTVILFASTVGIAKTAGWGGTPADGAGFSWKAASSLEEIEPAVNHSLSLVETNPSHPVSSPSQAHPDNEAPRSPQDRQAVTGSHGQSETGASPSAEQYRESGRQESDQQPVEPIGTDEVNPVNEQDLSESSDLGAPAEQVAGVDDVSELESPDFSEDTELEEINESAEDGSQEVRDAVGPSTKGWLAIVNQNVALHQSVRDIIDQWGSHYKEFHSAIDESIVWQYALGAVPHSPASDNPAEVNIAGLLAGYLEAQLFISWGPAQTVSSYALYYVDNGHVFEYRMFEDGQIRHNQISG